MYDYTVNFKGIESYIEMHYAIATDLDFPEYYGCNWDAFWDCLTDMCSMTPLHIEIIGLEELTVEKYGDSAETMLRILKRFKHVYNDKYAHLISIEIVHEDGRRESIE